MDINDFMSGFREIVAEGTVDTKLVSGGILARWYCKRDGGMRFCNHLFRPSECDESPAYVLGKNFALEAYTELHGHPPTIHIRRADDGSPLISYK